MDQDQTSLDHRINHNKFKTKNKINLRFTHRKLREFFLKKILGVWMRIVGLAPERFSFRLWRDFANQRKARHGTLMGPHGVFSLFRA